MTGVAHDVRAPLSTFGGFPVTPQSHLCVFHHGRAERDALLIPFLTEGLLQGHACRYYAAVGEKENIAAQLRKTSPTGPCGPDLIDLYEPEGGHLRDGKFDWVALWAGVVAWADQVFAEPHVSSARIAGDMSWAKPFVSPELVDELFESETNVTRWVRTRPVTALCFYDLELFGGDLIVPMVKAHPQVWMGGALVDNPYHYDLDAPSAHYRRACL
jgi:hypothetical protein